VFDASCREDTPSMNDGLEKGRNLIVKTAPLAMPFQEQRIGIISDIKLGFLQSAAAEKDRNFLRF
jgi:hypothetical protein